jgi:hypothetical protein
MAWNPSPEVAVARNAAKKLGDLSKSEVTQIVIAYITADGRIGYASYGQTKELCADARRLGDKMFEAALGYLNT